MKTLDDIIAALTPTLCAQTQINCYQYSDQVIGADLYTLAQRLKIDYYGYSEEFSNRCKKHWAKSWMCTDTVVGISLYSVDGEFVALSIQRGRKHDELIYFLSKELENKTKSVVLEYVCDEEMYFVPMISDEVLRRIIKESNYNTCYHNIFKE